MLLAQTATEVGLETVVPAVGIAGGGAQIHRAGRGGANGQVHGHHVGAVEIPVLIARTRGRQTEAAPTEAGVVTGLEGGIALAAVPVVLLGTGEVEAAVLPQRLGDAELETVALAIYLVVQIVAVAEPCVVLQAQETLAGEPIGSHREVGAGGVQQLAVGEPVALPAHGTAGIDAIRQATGLGMSDIRRQCAERRAESQAAQSGQVVLRDDAPGIGGHEVGDAVLVGALQEVGRIVQVVVAILAGCDVVAANPGAHQLRHRRIGYEE
ncbi:hypothetical protein D9M71_311460 [compost metagenome]